MAIVCPKCGRQYDVTLFEFGTSVLCDCGEKVNPFAGENALSGGKLEKREKPKTKKIRAWPKREASRGAPATGEATAHAQKNPRSSKSRHISAAASRKERRGS